MAEKTSIYFPPEVKAAGERYAAEQERSFSNLVVYCLKIELKRRGVKIPPGAEIEAVPVQGRASGEEK